MAEAHQDFMGTETQAAEPSGAGQCTICKLKRKSWERARPRGQGVAAASLHASPAAPAKNFSRSSMLCPLPAGVSVAFSFSAAATGCVAAAAAGAELPLASPAAAATAASTDCAGAALGWATPLRMGPPARSSWTNVATAS